MPKLSVIIPAYNEKDTILEIIKKVQSIEFTKEIIIVDDGSTDGTTDLLKGVEKSQATVLFHETNLGKGAAIRTALPGASGDITVAEGETSNEYIVWSDPMGAPYNPTPIVYGDYYSTLLDRGFFTCHNAKTGELVYGKQRISE